MTESEAIEAIQFDLKIGGEIHSQVLRDAVGVAIQVLEKQIPKKPNKEIFSSWGTKKEVHTCPVCDCYLTEVYFIAPKESKIKEKITYCEACGQAIDWSDEE